MKQNVVSKTKIHLILLKMKILMAAPVFTTIVKFKYTPIIFTLFFFQSVPDHLKLFFFGARFFRVNWLFD